MNETTKRVTYAIVLSAICIANKANLLSSKNICIEYFLNCYLNDILGTIVFLLCFSEILYAIKKDITLRLIHIELIVLFCGVFWEYITPIYRQDTISDMWDIIAYLFGGLCFWCFFYNKSLRKNKL